LFSNITLIKERDEDQIGRIDLLRLIWVIQINLLDRSEYS